MNLVYSGNISSDFRFNFTGPVNSSDIVPEDQQLKWTVTPVAEVVTSVLSFSFNGLVLLVFLVHKHLRTPFTLYIMGTLSYNCIFALLNNPFDIITAVSPNWLLSKLACDFYCYTGWVLSGVVINSHLLITVNRIWAITFPISYKQKHDKRMALILTGCLWIYVHVICLPGVVLDAVYYRLPVETSGCNVNTEAQKIWSLVALLAIFDFPILFITMAYPFLLYRQRKFMKTVVGQHPNGHAVSVAHELRTIFKGPGHNDDHVHSLPKSTPSKEASRSMLVLTMLTISILICYAPGQIFYTILSFSSMDLPLVNIVTGLLFALQAVMDPILFASTLKDLRNTIKGIVFCRGKG